MLLPAKKMQLLKLEKKRKKKKEKEKKKDLLSFTMQGHSESFLRATVLG